MTQDKQSLRPDAHDHVLFMYSDYEERMRGLAEYFGKGLERNELCIFVTPEPFTQVIKDFKQVGFDASQAVKNGSLRIFDMNDAYLPDGGDFVKEDMRQNVVDFIGEASANGYSGVRTAGEMAWLYDRREYLEDATAYEYGVNELNEEYEHFTGLCLYKVVKGAGDILDSALATHPNLIYGEGESIQANPLYKPLAV